MENILPSTHELSPKGNEVLAVLQSTVETGEPLTRSNIAERVGVPEQTVFRLLRDVRLCVMRAGFSLKTVRGKGYVLQKR